MADLRSFVIKTYGLPVKNQELWPHAKTLKAEELLYFLNHGVNDVMHGPRLRQAFFLFLVTWLGTLNLYSLDAKASAETSVDWSDRWLGWRAYWRDPRALREAMKVASEGVDPNKDPLLWLKVFSNKTLISIEELGTRAHDSDDVEKALEIAVKYELYEDQARLLAFKGVIAYTQLNQKTNSQKKEAAIDPSVFFEQSLALSKERGFHHDFLFAIVAYHEYLSTSGRSERLVSLINEGLAIVLAPTWTDHLERMNLEVAAADVFREQGALDKAEATFKKLAADCDVHTYQVLCSEILIGYSGFYMDYLKSKDYPRILHLLSRAEKLANEVDDDWGRHLSNYRKSRIFLQTGRYAEARDSAERVAVFFKDNSFRLYVMANLNSARALIGMNSIAEAIRVMKGLISMTDPAFVQEHIDIRRDLAHAYTLQGSWKDAYLIRTEQLDMEKAYLSDTQKQNMSKQVAQLGLQVEEARSRALEHENELQAKRLQEAELAKTFRNWAIGVVTSFSLASFAMLVLIQKKNRQIESSRQRIRSILDNIKVGIFSISDPVSLTIDRERSRNLSEVLGPSAQETDDLQSLLFDRSLIDAEMASLVKSCIKASLGEPQLSWELNASHLPQELQVNLDGKVRNLELDWNIILKPGTDIVQQILVSCRDVTMLRIYRDASELQQRELGLICELIDVPQTRFLQFADSARKALQESRNFFTDWGLWNQAQREHALKLISFHLHTVKGAARTLGLKELSRRIHAAEDLLATGLRTEARLQQPGIDSECESILNLIEEYVSLNKDKLNRGEKAADTVVLQREVIQGLLDQALSGQSLRADQITSLASLAYVPVTQLIEDSRCSIKRLAKELHRADPVLRTEGLKDTYLTSEAFSVLTDSFVHLIRNSMDHGIESAVERVQEGKSAAGTFTMRGQHTPEGIFILEFNDDGRGLALGKIRSKATAKGWMQSGQDYSASEIAEFIFRDGFSTASSITELSGRGVGMGAVRASIEKLGGQIQIEILGAGSQDYVPFKFVILIPSTHVPSIEIAGDAKAA